MREADLAQTPAYGSAEWDCLPDGDARKRAACIIAAECWATQAENLVRDLEIELRVAREANRTAEDLAYKAAIEQHAADWSWLTRAPRSPFADQEIPPRDLYDIGKEHREGLHRHDGEGLHHRDGDDG